MSDTPQAGETPSVPDVQRRSASRKLGRIMRPGSWMTPAPTRDLLEGSVSRGIGPDAKRAIWRWSFILFVAIPGIAAFVYYAFMASEIYESEARFVVRSISATPLEQGDGAASGSILGVPSSLDQDAYIIASYLASRSFYDELDAELDLKSLYGRSEVDFLNRLASDAKADEKADYLKDRLTTFVDGPSGIITFRAEAFTPDEAQKVVRSALAKADRIVDEISERAKQDLIGRAKSEVQDSLDRYSESLAALRDYQDETGILDPTGDAKLISELIGALTQKKLETFVELETLNKSGISETPRLRQLELLITAIDDQIAQLRGSLTSADSRGDELSGALVRFAELQTEKLLSEALYEATRRALDTANSAALRRSAFLAVFSQPTLPTEKVYPKVLRGTMLVIFSMFVLWATAMLIIAAVEDHME
jgi:capsular polysaccharide transport system permease protein